MSLILDSDDSSPPASPVYDPPAHQSTPNTSTARSQSTREPLSEQTNTTSEYQLILEELRKTSSRLDSFSKTLESVEKRLDSVERMSLDVTSSSDSSFEKKKKSVPLKVRVC